jgi:quinohemoprotein ethanol dehydrogenase
MGFLHNKTILLLVFPPFVGIAFTQPARVTTSDWPSYGNDPGAMRYVDLNQINTTNVSSLTPAWIFHTTVMNPSTSFESQPIVVNNTMYVTSSHGHVFALDPSSGALKWTFNPDIPPLSELAVCCGQTNRGVAVGDGKVFVGQLDASLVALDANSGNVVWKVQVDDYHLHWTETMAPLFVNGKVIIGASGGEFQLRGHVSAYDSATGKLAWRFDTVPGPGQKGNDTWAGNSWMRGGATVWTTPAVDPQLGLLYITTSNAAPDLNGSARAGDNLFTASVVALDVNTGAYKWHFQEVHHDLWDYDATQPVHLFTATKNGEQIPALAHANKNGNYFILDRRDGTPIFDVTETKVPTDPDWQHASPTQPMPSTDPLIPQSVETPIPGTTSADFWTPPQEQTLLIQPGFESGPEYAPSAFSPRTNYAYINAGGYDPWTIRSSPTLFNSLGSSGNGNIMGVQGFGLLDAVDTTTGKIVWKIQTPEKLVSAVTVAGDLVFFGEGNGTFNAVDAKSGVNLWSFKSTDAGVGGANGNSAAYVVNGREFIVMGFGGNARERGDGATSPVGDALIAFSLPVGNGPPAVVTASPKQVDTGAIPESNLIPPVTSAPPDATVVTLNTHDLIFKPNQFTVKAGQKVAVHIVNSGDSDMNFAVQLPNGTFGLLSAVKAGTDAFFVFTAPSQRGDFKFFNPLVPVRFFGKDGTIHVTS